jgi:hypothetical protein
MPGAAPTLSLTRRRPVFDTSKLYALNALSTALYYETQPAAGEVGDATNGFGVFELFYLAGLSSAQQFLSMNLTAPPGGFQIYQAANNQLQTYMMVTTTTSAIQKAWQLTPSDVGKLHVWGIAYDPTAALASRGNAYTSRLLVGNAGTSMAGYSPATSQTRWGASLTATSPSTAIRLMGRIAYRGVLSAGNLLALFDAIRTAGDVPASITGVTTTHRWSLRETLAARKHSFVTSQIAPAAIPDSVTAASADALTRVGLPSVQVIDASAEGRTHYGVLGYTDTSYLQSSGGIAGASGGFHLALRFAATQASSADVLVSRESAGGTFGYSVYLSTTALKFLCSNGSAYAIAECPFPLGPRAPMTALLRFSGGTGGSIRVSIDGVEGTPVTMGGTFAVMANSMRVGAKSPNATVPATTSVIYALSGGDVPITDGEASAFWRAASAGLALPRITGKTQHEWDVTQDVVAAGSTAMPALILDRVGSDHLARVGTALAISTRRERLWGYDASPVVSGCTGFTSTAYYANNGPGVLAGSTAGFWAAVSFVIDAQTAGTRTLFGSQDGVNGGWDIRLTGNTIGQLAFIDNGGGGRYTPNATISAADIGQVMLLVAVYDAAALKIRIYSKRAEVSTGTSVTGFRPSPVGARLGEHTLGGAASTNVAIFGAAYGVGVPTLGQVQALFDGVQANDGRMQVIPGLTSTLYDLPLDITGGSMNALILDRASGGINMARQGAPTVASRYSRSCSW